MDQHPEAADPCGEPTGAMSGSKAPDFLCQRGAGHPGPHEVMTRDGDHMEWGLSSVFPPDEDFGVDELDDEDDL